MNQINWIAFLTIVKKEIRRYTRIWMQTLLPPAITMVLYFIIFGNLIGSRIGEMGGFDYMAFIVPGLIMMAIITNSYGNVAASFYSTKFQRNIEELLVAPVSNQIILSGYVIGGASRGMAVGVIVTILSMFFTKLQIHNIFVILAVSMLTAIVFSMAGFINAMLANSFDDISIIPTFVLTPLTYLGGVFYSISMLPPFWQVVSQFNPVLYMVNAFRYGILGVSDVNIWFSFAMLGMFAVILYTVCLYLLNKGTGIKQ
ncbi:MAG: ABC transporter permease [Saccharospirillaceae bacterium]|nr:ABC transporter permease [Pseudomonadales bacterium]NRB80021.1 ABC transporter permease [Saccharospirillaceae bacterium]